MKFPEQWREFKTGDEVLTFVNRDHEPHRGFHIFMRALPKVLEARPQARIVIVGGDEQSYSPRPGANKTWRQVMLAEVGDRLDLSRVHFVGKIPYATFIDLMRVSRVHAYLTYPFVLSWSMMDAMSAGCFVVGSRTSPVEEMISDGVNGRLVDFFDVAAWSETLIDTLAHPEKYEHLQAAARRTIVETYDLRKHCLPRLVEFVEGELECTPGPHPLRATRTAQGLPPQAEEDRKSGVFLRFRGQVAAHCGTQCCRRWGALRRALKALRS